MIKISIVGPESSGKSTLALSLSQKLECEVCEEHSRKYLEKKKHYDISDLKTIAKQQDKLIKKVSTTTSIMKDIFKTDRLTNKNV